MDMQELQEITSTLMDIHDTGAIELGKLTFDYLHARVDAMGLHRHEAP